MRSFARAARWALQTTGTGSGEAGRPAFARFTLRLLLVLVSVAAVPGAARAHSGNPAVAYLDNPVGVGIVVSDAYVISWADSDVPIPTGTATVDLFYTARRPKTFAAGVVPGDLQGTPIATGILEKDLENRVTWDLRGVPSGSYHVWSRVNEPPEEVDSLQIIDFAPGVVTVVQPGEPVHPAILATSPANAFTAADEQFELTYIAFDPDGSGRVRVEAAEILPDGSTGTFQVLAEDLPAVAEGRWIWDTRTVPEGDWMFRLTVEDARGLSFSTYARFFLLISHPGRLDAGLPDAPAVVSDAGFSLDAAPGPTTAPPPAPAPSDGCRCTAPAPPAPVAGGLLAAALTWCATHRRRPGPRPRRTARSSR